MAKLKITTSRLFRCIVLAPVLIAGCTTDDVDVIVPDTDVNLVEIRDPALGEYLVYNSRRTDAEKLPGGTAVEVDGKYYLDIDKAAKAENLYLVKNDTQIKKLAAAGLSTAADKITSIDVLPYFVSLKTLKLTSNEIRTLDITQCSEIETIEMNYNLVSSLDMSNAVRLRRLRYGSNSDTADDCKLSAIDLSNCAMLEHVFLKNQNIGTDGFVIPDNYAALTEIDMSGNPGAPFEIPAELYGQLTTANGVTPIKDPEPEQPSGYYEVPDEAFGEYLLYLAGGGTLPADIIKKEGDKYLLDTEVAATVTVLNVAKTSKIITTLTEAGLSTAATPISSADGLQYFTSLKEFTATSNNFTTALPLSELKNLEILQVNTAGVRELDLSANTRLRVLNCNGSSKYAKLKSLDLQANKLIETLNLKNNELETLDMSDLTGLTDVDLSGNPGADFPVPAGIYDNLKTKKGVRKE